MSHSNTLTSGRRSGAGLIRHRFVSFSIGKLTCAGSAIESAFSEAPLKPPSMARPACGRAPSRLFPIGPGPAAGDHHSASHARRNARLASGYPGRLLFRLSLPIRYSYRLLILGRYCVKQRAT